MKKIAPVLVAAFACSFSQLASAVAVRATFDGIVSGSSGIFANVLDDFPLGTTASFDVTFDDAGFVHDAAALNDFDVAPVSGSVRLGSLEWLLDAGRIWTYTYLIQPGNPVVSYGLQLTGAGPSIAGGTASLFGLFLMLTPDATAFGSEGPKIGFKYPFDGGELYSYADLSGDFTTSRENRSVPEPNALLLMGGGLVLLGWLRRSRRVDARLNPALRAQPRSCRSP